MEMKSNKSMRASGKVKSLTKDAHELSLVNELALEPLQEDEVYLFEVVACDNDIDRDFERFADEALCQMAQLLVGRTVIKDHERSADNQFARVYAAEVQDAQGKATSDGRPLKQLVVKCYTLDNDANSQLISEIRAGIKKEVSVSFQPDVVECSICGTDRRRSRCKHFWGEEYDGEVCHFSFKDIADAYELSFVAVPAQRNAGTRKDYEIDGSEADPPEAGDDDPAPDEGAANFAKARMRVAEAQRTERGRK